jgi:poly(A) polymerase
MMSEENSIQPVVVPREKHTVSRDHLSDGAIKVLSVLNEAGHEAYIVGGGVRDLLLGRKPKDFDIVTDARPEQVKRIFRNCRLIGRRFRLAHVHIFGEIIEVSTFRANISVEETGDGETPAPPPPPGTFVAREDGLVLRDNVYGNAETDALRRDFTINALFYNMRNFSVIDYVGGMADIRDRIIRSIGPAEVRYTEDPVRMIRAIRIASQLDCTIEPSSYQAIIERCEHLAHANPHRLFEEVKKLLWCGAVEKVMDHLVATGLFGILFPELSDVASREMELAWIKRVTRQFDIWHKNHLQISNELMLALLFGKYHEQQANAMIQDGASPAIALDTATREHLTRLMSRIAIPKFLAVHIGQIMSVQPRFLQLKESNASRLKHRGCFHDAFIYFKLNSRFNNRHQDEVQWWERHGSG